VPVKVNALCHLAPGNGEENGTAPAIARALKVFERQGGLHDVLRLDEQELLAGDLLQDLVK
jgi:hypothetical protein